MNPSFREVKSLHLFLHDFGTVPAPMAPYFPAKMPASNLDTETPRVAARVTKNQGFVFINNYQRTYRLPVRKNFQVQLKMESGTITVPRRPVNIPSGAYPIWPVSLQVGGTVLEYATAQLLCKLEEPNTLVFFAWPGVPQNLRFGRRMVNRSKPLMLEGRENGDWLTLTRSSQGKKHSFGFAGAAARTPRSSSQTKRPGIFGGQRLMDSSGCCSLLPTYISRKNRSHLIGTSPSQMNFGIFPKPERALSGFIPSGRDGIFYRYASRIEGTNVTAVGEKLMDASPRPQVSLGRGVATVPDEAAFDGAARWSIRVPPINSAFVKHVFLRISYEGDVARVYEHGKLVTDDFFKGTPWEIGIRTPAAQGGTRNSSSGFCHYELMPRYICQQAHAPPFLQVPKSSGLKTS
jgi:beta-galactosidase